MSRPAHDKQTSNVEPQVLGDGVHLDVEVVYANTRYSVVVANTGRKQAVTSPTTSTIRTAARPRPNETVSPSAARRALLERRTPTTLATSTVKPDRQHRAEVSRDLWPSGQDP